MGILVQREFTVRADHRQEFERQSRVGLWPDMRYNGAQMIGFGSWAFGGPGDVLVTNSVYADFDHWTATRPWGAFRQDAGREEETSALRAVFAGRQRLIEHSRATIIEYDSALSEPSPFYRDNGAPLAALPKTFGRQSIIAETLIKPRSEQRETYLALAGKTEWPWLAERGARLVVCGADALADRDALVVLTAYRSITHWHETTNQLGKAPFAQDRRQLIEQETARLLMIQTDFGELV